MCACLTYKHAVVQLLSYLRALGCYANVYCACVQMVTGGGLPTEVSYTYRRVTSPQPLPFIYDRQFLDPLFSIPSFSNVSAIGFAPDGDNDVNIESLAVCARQVHVECAAQTWNGTSVFLLHDITIHHRMRVACFARATHQKPCCHTAIAPDQMVKCNLLLQKQVHLHSRVIPCPVNSVAHHDQYRLHQQH